MALAGVIGVFFINIQKIWIRGTINYSNWAEMTHLIIQHFPANQEKQQGWEHLYHLTSRSTFGSIRTGILRHPAASGDFNTPVIPWRSKKSWVLSFEYSETKYFYKTWCASALKCWVTFANQSSNKTSSFSDTFLLCPHLRAVAASVFTIVCTISE